MKNFKDKIIKTKNKKKSLKIKFPIQIIEDLDPFCNVKKGRTLIVYDFCCELYPGCYLYTSKYGHKKWIEEGNIVYMSLMRFLNEGIISVHYHFVFED